VNDALGKDWVFWVTAIQLIIGIIIMFFFMEEVSCLWSTRDKRAKCQTNYNRGTTEMVEKHDSSLQRNVASSIDGNASETEKEAMRDITQTTVAPVELEGVEYSFVQKLRMFDQRYTSTRIFFQMMYRPFFHLRFPVVVW
jgi:hypothetical protein